MNDFQFYTRLRSLIKPADQWREDAENVLYWARCALDKPGESAFNGKALLLVDRCFKVNSLWTTMGRKLHLQKIKSVFRLVADFYAEAGDSSCKDYITIGPPIRPGDNAYAEVGGWKAGDKKGITYVKAACGGWSDEDLIDLKIHETVHFAGNIGHFDLPNGDPAYGKAVFSLTADQALTNASSYAYLAYLAHKPDTEWLTAT